MFVLKLSSIKIFRSRSVDGKRFLESNASSIPGTYFRLGRNLLPSSALDPNILTFDNH